MATASGKSCEPTAVERFGSGGKALLPWTKQLLTVLWEQLRLLVHIIYYTFVSVFQMFRFEVHLRITDETGQHIQHMSSAANPSDSFLFSSLFDGDGGVMVGGSGTLSNFCADVGGKTPAEALLSSLRADDLCCGLVDDFVTHDGGGGGGGGGGGVFLGHFPADWKVFVSGGDHSCGDAKSREESASGPEWSSEEEQSAAEFDSEESKALWESLSSSNDPYNPFFFSACISTSADMGRSKGEASDGGVDLQLMAPAAAAGLVRRSDSESSWSSWASDGSGADAEESERLLELFRSPDDPYNPMCFTACTFSADPDATRDRDRDQDQDEEERLWSSLGRSDDPYHPLNFQATPTSGAQAPPTPRRKVPATPPKRRPSLAPQKKKKKQQLRSASESDVTLVPWRRAGTAPRTPPPSAPERTAGQEGSAKKVRFSPVVQVHVMRSWLFARQACRKGPWEEMARDRDRFQRRITDTERAIAHCLSPDHRERVWAEHLDSSQDEDL